MIVIAAVSNDGKIGHDNDMLWHIPEDFKWYKTCTTGNLVVIGRNTYEVLPTVAFKNRSHLVITSDASKLDIHENLDIEFTTSIDIALEKIRYNNEDAKDIYLAGGSKIYHEMLKHCDEAYITWISNEYSKANKTFPINELFCDFETYDISKKSYHKDLSYRIFKYKRKIK